MICTAGILRRICSARSFRNTISILALAVFVLAFGESVQAYDGPTFTKGLWLFQRSTEFVTRHWILPNARRIKVEPAVVRCVNPTEAMIETFRQVSIGSCASTLPEKQKTTFLFAKRCDYLGPVKTLISVESETAYVETNETIGSSPKKEIVKARRIGDCSTAAEIPDAAAYATAEARKSWSD